MPDFKTHYAIIMLTIAFVLGFFLLLQSQRSFESVTGLESVTGGIVHNPENDAEKVIFNYLSYFKINGDVKDSYYKNGMWRVDVDILDSNKDVVFDVDDNGDIKCFERDRERKCYNNLNNLNQEFLATFN